MPTPLGSPSISRHKATVGSYGGAGSYKRGTPAPFKRPPPLSKAEPYILTTSGIVAGNDGREGGKKRARKKPQPHQVVSHIRW